MPYLARRFTVLAPDLIGHGELGQAARRLLARRPRERPARPAGRRSGTSAPRSSGTRSAGASRCSSPTSSPSSASGSCSSTAAASAARSARCCAPPTLPGSELRAAAPGRDAAARRRRAWPPACSRAWACAWRTDIEEMARGHATLIGSGGAGGLHAHAARRSIEPGGQRDRRPPTASTSPGTSRCMLDVGRARHDHPGLPRPRRARAAPGQPPGDLPAAPATSRSSTSPSASSTCSTDFMRRDDRAGGACDTAGLARAADDRLSARCAGQSRQSARTSSTTLPVARRSSSVFSASAACSSGKRCADDRPDEALVDHAADRRADLAVEVAACPSRRRPSRRRRPRCCAAAAG